MWLRVSYVTSLSTGEDNWVAVKIKWTNIHPGLEGAWQYEEWPGDNWHKPGSQAPTSLEFSDIIKEVSATGDPGLWTLGTLDSGREQKEVFTGKTKHQLSSLEGIIFETWCILCDLDLTPTPFYAVTLSMPFALPPLDLWKEMGKFNF